MSGLWKWCRIGLGLTMILSFTVFSLPAGAETVGGPIWTNILPQPQSVRITALAIDRTSPNIVYVGTYGAGILKTTDGGANWSAANNGLPSDVGAKTFTALAIDPLTPNIVYAAAYGGGMFKSMDGGESWSAINAGLTQLSVESLAIDPVTPTTLYAGTIVGVFKSTDGGVSWSGPIIGMRTKALAIDPSMPSTIYAGTYFGMYKSMDGGVNWSGGTGGMFNALAIDPATRTTIYSGTWAGVYKSMDNGINWGGTTIGTRVNALAIDPVTPSTIYAGVNSGGVFRSIDSGVNWTVVNAGLSNTTVLGLVVDPTTPTTIYLVGSLGGLFKGNLADITSPNTSGGLTPAPNQAGWNNTDVTVTLTATDENGGSGVREVHYIKGNEPEAVFGGSSASLRVSDEGITLIEYWAVDNTGNVETHKTLRLKIDETFPGITFGETSPAVNAAGWNNTDVSIPFTAVDSGSGVVSTSIPSPLIFTTEGSGLKRTIDVVDAAGNVATFTSPAVNIDKTAPVVGGSRTPGANVNGWNNTDVTSNFTCSDTGSGVDSCSGPIVLSVDGTGQSATGTAVDKAGNTASAVVSGINIDKTAPIISGSRTPGANANGWSNTDVTVSFTCSDNGSGMDNCASPTTVSSEGSGQSVTGTGLDKAGNSAAATVSGINIDKTAPIISGSRTPGANVNGWNNTDVIVSFTCSDSVAGVDSCTGPTTVSSEGSRQSVAGTVVDKAGNTAAATVSGINIDKTAPVISGSRTPGANANGWNNTDVTVSFTCSDNGSGVDSCSSPTTLSLDGPGQSVNGTGLDKAGNSAATTVSGINIDKTAPVITYTGNPGSYMVDQTVNILSSAADVTSGIVSSTCQNINGPAYTFLLGTNTFSAAATDRAGNIGSNSTSFTVTVNCTSLGVLVQRFVNPPEKAKSLLSRLDAIEAAAAKGNTNAKASAINAFINQVQAQTGKTLTADQAAILIRLAQAL